MTSPTRCYVAKAQLRPMCKQPKKERTPSRPKGAFIKKKVCCFVGANVMWLNFSLFLCGQRHNFLCIKNRKWGRYIIRVSYWQDSLRASLSRSWKWFQIALEEDSTQTIRAFSARCQYFPHRTGNLKRRLLLPSRIAKVSIAVYLRENSLGLSSRWHQRRLWVFLWETSFITVLLRTSYLPYFNCSLSFNVVCHWCT